jgi:hypothetical protein
MPAQPQQQIRDALTAVDQALKLEPELADKATLQHARNLLQRVYDKNAGETSSPRKPGALTGYRDIAGKAIAAAQQ